jgi:hypothetical protein
MFHTCGICDREFGLEKMELLSDPEVALRIALSPLKKMWEKQIAPKDDPNATSQARGYATAMFNELLDGILRNAKYACKLCVSQLPKLTKAQKRNLSPPSPHQEEFRCAPDTAAPPNMRKIIDLMNKWSDLHQDDSERGVSYHESEERVTRVDALSEELAQLTKLEHIIFFAKREYYRKLFYENEAAGIPNEDVITVNW